MADGLFPVFCSVRIYFVFVNAFYDIESSVTNTQAGYRNIKCKLKECFLNACATSGSQMQLLRYDVKNADKRWQNVHHRRLQSYSYTYNWMVMFGVLSPNCPHKQILWRPMKLYVPKITFGSFGVSGIFYVLL
jgi:hypothetical protein